MMKFTLKTHLDVTIELFSASGLIRAGKNCSGSIFARGAEINN